MRSHEEKTKCGLEIVSRKSTSESGTKPRRDVKRETWWFARIAKRAKQAVLESFVGFDGGGNKVELDFEAVKRVKFGEEHFWNTVMEVGFSSGGKKSKKHE